MCVVRDLKFIDAMDLVGTIWDATKSLCGCVSHHAAYALDLEDNLRSLKNKWKEVKAMKKYVQTKVEEAENTGRMQRTELVNNWLQQIQSFQNVSLISYIHIYIYHLFNFSCPILV